MVGRKIFVILGSLRHNKNTNLCLNAFELKFEMIEEYSSDAELTSRKRDEYIGGVTAPPKNRIF